MPLEQEIGFDPEAIAQVLKARAERPSGVLIEDAKEIGIDLTQEGVSQIFLFNEQTRLEQHLMLYPRRRSVMLHSRINIDGDSFRPSRNIDLGSQSLGGISSILTIPEFGHVRFISKRESGDITLDVWHDCRYAFSAL